MEKTTDNMNKPILQAVESQPLAVAVPGAPVAGVPVAIPVLAAFENIPLATLPQADWTDGLSPQVWGILAASESLTVRQHLKLFPKYCCGCPPCLRQENAFSVYAGLGQDQLAEILRVDEVSDDWNRCCCYPNHPFKLEIRQYIPGSTEALHSGSGHDHFFADVMRNAEQFSGKEHEMKVREMYKQSAVAMTAVREGVHCKCCFGSDPGCCHRAYGCWILNSWCADGE
jgi:hypothetical protein